MSDENDNNSMTTKEDSRNKRALRAKYAQRITIAKQGRELFINKDYTNAAKKYNEYLNILAQSQDTEDIYQISPAKFDPKKDVTEMLLISHIYWELSRIYEMTPKLQNSFDKCLKQFVRFTINQPYQVLNSEVLRKYIKKNKNKSRQIRALQNAYSQIQVQSRKCFVATFALGEGHWATTELRLFKSRFLGGDFGSRLVGIYYQISHPLVKWLETKPRLARATTVICGHILPAIALAAKTTRKLGQCIFYRKS